MQFVIKILPAFHNKQENNEIKNHLAVLFVRVSLSIHPLLLFLHKTPDFDCKILHSFHPNRSWEHQILYHWKVSCTQSGTR